MQYTWAQFQNGNWPGNKSEERNLSITVKYKLNINQQIWNKLEKACALNEKITKKKVVWNPVLIFKSTIQFCHIVNSQVELSATHTVPTRFWKNSIYLRTFNNWHNNKHICTFEEYSFEWYNCFLAEEKKEERNFAITMLLPKFITPTRINRNLYD